MRREQRYYYVYILTNRSGTLYTGMTGNLERRIDEHRQHAVPGFTSRYKIARLVYLEQTTDVYAAKEREREIKAWTRAKRIGLINNQNPRWLDLASELYKDDSQVAIHQIPPSSGRHMKGV